MSSNSLPLRPHHGMCLSYFQGKGYSSGFTNNLATVKHLLEDGASVCLTCGADLICAHCPNLREGICCTAEKVEHYDRAVLEYCGLREGQILPYAVFSALVAERILRPGHRPAICGDCQWNSLCQPFSNGP